METILIVEDEIKLRDELKLFLENNGYLVKIIDNFDDTINSIQSKDANLILLDINLPNINGEFICKELRKITNIPIIIITSRNNEMDELISLSYGADDFITKPYNLPILLARISRILNRSNQKENIMIYKDTIIDLERSIIKNGDKTIDLSKNELRILSYLLKNQGKIISRDNLINYLWDDNEFIDDNTLTVNINRLRMKLEEIGLGEVIITKRSQGYIIL